MSAEPSTEQEPRPPQEPAAAGSALPSSEQDAPPFRVRYYMGPPDDTGIYRRLGNRVGDGEIADHLDRQSGARR